MKLHHACTRARTRSAFIRFVTPFVNNAQPIPPARKLERREREKERLSTCRVGNARFQGFSVYAKTLQGWRLVLQAQPAYEKPTQLYERTVYYVHLLPLPRECRFLEFNATNERLKVHATIKNSLPFPLFGRRRVLSNLWIEMSRIDYFFNSKNLLKNAYLVCLLYILSYFSSCDIRRTIEKIKLDFSL